MAKPSYEKWKVYGNVFDEYTLRLLFKLSSQGHFEELKSPIALGKEANIFTAEKDGGLVIVKVYRLHTCNFNKMYDYIKSDRRFKGLKKQRRKVIFNWVLREYQNIIKTREAGVRVPTPIAVHDHVLILEMIGDKTPAPQWKDVELKDKDKFSEKLIEYMNRMHKAGLVHGDLSEFNILVHNDLPVFIDFSQGTTSRDPHFEEYWLRDIKNIARTLNKNRVKISEDELKEKVFK